MIQFSTACACKGKGDPIATKCMSASVRSAHLQPARRWKPPGWSSVLRVLVAGCVSALLASAQTSAREPSQSTPSNTPREPVAGATAERRALLVGVTDFQDARFKPRALKGPANDVELFRQVLIRAPLSVPAANIRVLRRGADPTLRPTHSNIAREFARLAETSRKGDQVVILLAGHGSQQPADSDPADNEPDGLDEIFLPEDIGPWDGTIGRVKNAVVDDDIRVWVNRIRNNGAFVWLIFDSCHSGTMTRGVEVERQIPMSELVPATAIAAAGDSARRANPDSDILGLSDSAGDVAALYAAHMAETTPEKPLPNPNSPVHGLFTYTIADILSQSSSALTYRELALRVLEQYRSVPRYSPTPLFEGGGLNREVLGQLEWPERPQMLLGERLPSGSWILRAGSVHGLTVGSILEIFPPAGSAGADRRIGYVRVASVTPTSSSVVPTTFDNVTPPTAARLPVASRARVRYYEFGDFRLKVAFRPGRPPAALERALLDLPTSTNGLAERVTTGQADWIVRTIDRRVVLQPADESPSNAANQFVIGDIADAAIHERLATTLKRIGRARNLMRLAAASGSGLRLDLRVIRYTTASSSAGRPLFSTPGDVVIRAGEFAEFRVRNPGSTPVDVTVLYVDAAFGIQPLYPARDREIDNQLKPGEERVIGRFEVDDMPLGWESAVAIAVASTPERQNFAMLAQESLDIRRGSDRAPISPLSQLLERALFGSENRTRGADVDTGTFAAKVVTWRTDTAR